MAKCSLTDLKRFLSKKSDDQLKEEIIEIFKLYPNIREYYAVKVNSGNEDELLQKYKKIVKNEFFPDRGFGKLRYAILKKAVSDFVKVSKIPTNFAELMVFYVELGVEFTNTFGDIDEKFYNNILMMYDKALNYVSKEDLEDIFLRRLRGIMDRGNGIGWGFSENLCELYYSYFED